MPLICPVDTPKQIQKLEEAKKKEEARLSTNSGLRQAIRESNLKAPKKAREYKPGVDDPHEYAKSQRIKTVDLPKRDVIREKHKGKLGWFKAKWEGFKRGWVDKLSGLEYYSKRAYTAFRLHAGSMGAAEHFVEFGGFKFGDPTQKTSKPLKEIFSFKTAKEQEEFKSYLHARGTLGHEAKGLAEGREIKTQFSVEWANDFIKKYETPEYKEKAKELRKYQNSVLDYAVDSGLVSKESSQTMKDNNPFYIPFYRFVEGKSGSPLSGQTDVYNPIKRIKGGDYLIIDPLEAIAKNTLLFTQLANKNAIMRTLVEDIQKNKALEGVLEELKPELEGKKALIKQAEELTGIDAEKLWQEAPESLLDIALTDAKYITKDNTLAVFIDGKKQLFKVDEDLGNYFKGLERTEVGLAMSMMHNVAAFLRKGATILPDFQAKAFFRDMFEGTIKSQFGINPADMVRAIAEFKNKGEMYQRWIATGGSYGGRITQKSVIRNLERLGTDWSKIKHIVVDEVGGLEVLGRMLDSAPRLAEFEAGIKQADAKMAEMKLEGKSEAEIQAYKKKAYDKATLASRDVTLDFQRMGTKMRALNSVIPFSNAFAQGLDTARTTIFVPRLSDSGKVTYQDTIRPYMMMATGIVLPTVALAAVNASEGWFKDQPQYVKDNFWLVKVDDTIFKFPKPIEYGMVVANGAERFMEYMIEQDPKVFADYFSQTTNIFEARMLIPTAIAPFLEGYSNRELFSGRRLVPMDVEKNLAKYRYGIHTSETSKHAASAIAAIFGDVDSNFASPVWIDNLVAKWAGSAGRVALNITDRLLKAADIGEPPILPEKGFTEQPLVSSFFGRYPILSAKSIEQFWDRHEHLQQYKTTATRLEKEGRRTEAAKLRAKLAIEVKDDKTYRAMIKSYQALRNINRSRSIGSVEKRRLQDMVILQMTQMAQRANEIARR